MFLRMSNKYRENFPPLFIPESLFIYMNMLPMLWIMWCFENTTKNVVYRITHHTAVHLLTEISVIYSLDLLYHFYQINFT